MSGSAFSLTEDIDFFFTNPLVEWQAHQRPHGQRSVLYLVRQDAMDCLVNRRMPERDVPRQTGDFHRLFAATLVLFAGIDLLAKFFAGDDARGQGKVGERFKDFTKRYLSLSEEEAEALYGVRNTLVHSFGLYDKDQHRTVSIVERCGEPEYDYVPVSLYDDVWRLCVPQLYRAFVDAISAYEHDVRNDSALQAKFDRIFPHYGWIQVFVSS